MKKENDMTIPKQKSSASRSIVKTGKAWLVKTSPEHRRAKPGTTGEGNYYRIEVRPKGEFTMFRYHDIGSPGQIQRLAGRRTSGSWDDQAWLIEKHMAHREGDRLIADNPDAKKVLETIGPAMHVKGDVFRGHPRRNVPESDKPTKAQRRAQTENIKKAQEARLLHQ